MLGSIAEFENAIRKERQTDGIARAKAIGVKIKDLMESFGLSKASIYRLLGASDLG
ncbi:MAG: hypothetical protein IBX55_20130 [Methyloprofundus sp.]|nr:hypothetical protein [Methyloprofundus sp.]MBW6452182.1 recombinase family protein [Methyloprofundus sp.]